MRDCSYGIPCQCPHPSYDHNWTQWQSSLSDLIEVEWSSSKPEYRGNPHYSLVYLSVSLFYLNPHHILSMDSPSSRFLLQPSLVHSAGAATISPPSSLSLLSFPAHSARNGICGIFSFLPRLLTCCHRRPKNSGPESPGALSKVRLSTSLGNCIVLLHLLARG